MLDENQISDAVCDYLKSQGYTIEQQLPTTQTGIDIIAHHSESGVRYYIEVKGGTSSRINSERFGTDFDDSQVLDCVAKGLYTALSLYVKYYDSKKNIIALSCPDSELFRKHLDPVIPLTNKMGIKILLVNENRAVSIFK